MINEKESILLETGEIWKNLYLIDLQQYGARRITSSFIYWDGEICLLMDCGTSDDVGKIIRYLRKLNIPYEKIIGICGTHYHFDHMGGATTLWKRMIKKNSEFKIYVPQDTYNYLQDAAEHLKGAHTTFGDFIGKMPPAPESAYSIVEKNAPLPFDFSESDGDISIELISCPGHSPDHCAPTLKKNGKVIFTFSGEACGSIFHSSKLVSIPTSMPPNFNYNEYMKNVDMFREMAPLIMGFDHFGAVNGKEAVIHFIDEHASLMKTMREALIEAHGEQDSVKYIMKKTFPLWKGRFDETLSGNALSGDFLNRLRLALTYGQLIDLGFRESKYEKRNNSS